MQITKTKCPICRYIISDCTCIHSDIRNPEFAKTRDVVMDHLYMLNSDQINHIMKLEKFWDISYKDAEKNRILNKLKNDQMYVVKIKTNV